MGYGVPGLNIVSGCALRMFPDEISVWICGFRTAVDGPPQSGWASSNPRRVWIAQKAEDGGIHPPLFFPVSLRERGHPISSSALRLGFTQPAAWVLGPLDSDRIMSPVFLHLQLTEIRLRLPNLHNRMTNSLEWILFQRYIYLPHTHTHAHTYVYILTHIWISDTRLHIYTDIHISIITKYICMCQYIRASYICNIT